MESVSNVEKKWRTRQEKDELIAQWKLSGKSRKLFSEDRGLNYNSFVTWHKEQKAKAKSETGFAHVIVQSGEKLFAPLRRTCYLCNTSLHPSNLQKTNNASTDIRPLF